jgi:uncharacterized protein YbaP (TraB family)
MNNSRTLTAALIASATCAAVAIAQSASTAASDSGSTSSSGTTLAEVLVTGEQPGPGLWKVTKGDHVLWIFGTYGPLPKKVSWRSKEVEAILAASQELITPVDVKPKIGFFGAISMLPSLIGIRNSPDKAKIKDLVPADQYARWLVQKEKYIGRDSGIEKWRPSFAVGELYGEAIDSWGFKKPSFPPSDELREQIEKLAKKHKVHVNNLELILEVEKPRAWVKDIKKLHIEDLACFNQSLEAVETDRESMGVRANAWAVGDIATLRPKLNEIQKDPCIDVFLSFLNSDPARDRGFNDIPKTIVSIWVAAAEAALAKNSSTFAVLSIGDIYWSDGYVAALRAKGYTVEEP